MPVSDFSVFERYRSENFATSILVFALRNSERFRAEFFQLVTTCARLTPLDDVTAITVARDVPIAGGKKPDILLTATTPRGKVKCVVEVKISAGEGVDQLKAYRDWLAAQSECWCTGLVTLTRDRLVWSVQPDGALVWRDLLPVLVQMRNQATGFEQRFWDQLTQHVEATMPTFDRFSSSPGDLLQFFREIDLFLTTLLRTMGLAGWSDDWRANRAAYWVQDFGVGFWWWHGAWERPVVQNVLAVQRRGIDEPIPIATLDDVVAQTEVARAHGALDVYFRDLAGRVRAAATIPPETETR